MPSGEESLDEGPDEDKPLDFTSCGRDGVLESAVEFCWASFIKSLKLADGLLEVFSLEEVEAVGGRFEAETMRGERERDFFLAPCGTFKSDPLICWCIEICLCLPFLVFVLVDVACL